MESKEETDNPPKEVKIRHSWHGDDGDENDNSMQIATFWNLFSLEPNTWSAESSSSEIGLKLISPLSSYWFLIFYFVSFLCWQLFYYFLSNYFYFIPWYHFYTKNLLPIF